VKQQPTYPIASVDHALRLAAILQLEGALTVTEAADRLGVARSTAHRLLSMLVYRDFASQGDDKTYSAGPVIRIGAHSWSRTARLRSIALPHLRRLADGIDESVNLAILTGVALRFVASVECRQELRVTSREGMSFPACNTSSGLVLLADLPADAVERLYELDNSEDRPDPSLLARELAKVRRDGYAVNHGRSERGVVAVGVPIRGLDGQVLAGLSVSIPSTRYDVHRLRPLVAALHGAAQGLESELRSWAEWDSGNAADDGTE